MSCWTELSETQQDELIQSMQQALTSQNIPEITQTLLNLAEFMEHCDKVRISTNVGELSTAFLAHSASIDLHMSSLMKTELIAMRKVLTEGV